MDKIVFLDRDGVICEEKNLLHKKEDIKLIDKSAEAIRILNENGYRVIVATNQPVVARSLCTEEELNEINNHLQELLKKHGAKIDRSYYCPHHPTKGDNPKYTRECECRKPKAGMILSAIKDLDIKDIKECYIVGDTIGDIKTGDNVGCKTILVKTGYGGKGEYNDAIPMFTAENLHDAVTRIILPNKKPLKIFINAGGKGERLYPLTKDIPKPLVLICGKPVLHHMVDWAKNNEIDEIVMMNGYMAEKIIDYFKNGENFKIKITHSVEPHPLGSGGPLKFASRYVDGRLVHISGDQFCDINLRKMLEFHEKNNSQITVLVHESSHPQDSDILNIDENGKVINFISKHEDHSEAGNLTNAGLAIIEPEIIDLMKEEVFNFENYLYPILLQKNIKFYGYHTEEFMHDMGTFDRLKKCEDYLINKLKGRVTC